MDILRSLTLYQQIFLCILSVSAFSSFAALLVKFKEYRFKATTSRVELAESRNEIEQLKDIIAVLRKVLADSDKTGLACNARVKSTIRTMQ